MPIKKVINPSTGYAAHPLSHVSRRLSHLESLATLAAYSSAVPGHRDAPPVGSISPQGNVECNRVTGGADGQHSEVGARARRFEKLF
jgi:hypothetical protein